MKRGIILVFSLVFMSFSFWGDQTLWGRDYPENAVDIIVPYNPGGGNDLTARLLSTYFGKTMGLRLNVINKVGGAGTIGLQAALTAKADGYTLLMDTHGIGSMIAFYSGKYPIDWRDRTWIARIVEEPMVYVTRVDAPWKNLKELAAAILKSPKEIRWGVTGLSGSSYATGVQFFNATNIPIDSVNIVMFQGNPEVVAALAGGHIDAASVEYSQSVSMVRGGKIRAIAAAGEKRLPLFPEAPSAAEQGYPMLNISGYQGMAGPPGLSKDVVDFWVKALEKASKDPEFIKQAENLKQIVSFLGPKDYQSFVEKQYNQYVELSKAAAK